MFHKRNALDCYIKDLHILFELDRFKDALDLYKYLVNLVQSPLEPLALSEEEQKINQFQDYLAQLRKTLSDQEKFYSKSDSSWTYVEVEFNDHRSEYRDLIKIYAPVEYTNLTMMARYVFDYLFKREKFFCFKIAHAYRLDTIALWITRDELEPTVGFLQAFLDELLPAPLFYPEYKNIGISRELSTSLNYMIALTLFKYLGQTDQPSFADYVESTHRQLQYAPLKDHTAFDQEILLRSLMCLLSDQCPVSTSNFNIVDYYAELPN